MDGLPGRGAPGRYIDGYNLYYSRLRGTAFKWLDIVALFRDRILQVQDPSAQVTRVKFFTAPIKANYARHGQASEHAQAQYHRALTAKYPELVQEPKAFTSPYMREVGLAGWLTLAIGGQRRRPEG
jgi:hypothetical protein